MVSNGSQFSSDMWQRACRCIRDIFTSTVPSELLTWRPEMHTMGLPTPESTPTHSPTLTPAQGHSFDNVSYETPRVQRKLRVELFFLGLVYNKIFLAQTEVLFARNETRIVS